MANTSLNFPFYGHSSAILEENSQVYIWIVGGANEKGEINDFILRTQLGVTPL
jgi:hypothetical protein